MIGQAKSLHFIVKTNLDAVQSGTLVVSLLSASSTQLSQMSSSPRFLTETLMQDGHYLLHDSKDGT